MWSTCMSACTLFPELYKLQWSEYLETISMNKLVLTAFLFLLLQTANSQEWINHGGDVANRRFASYEQEISPLTAPSLSEKWRYFTGSDVTATPAIYDGVIYFPSWNGGAYAVDIHGNSLWKVNLTSVTNIQGALSRATPTMTKHLAIFSILRPPVVVALDRRNGAFIWISDILSPIRLSQITMSGTAHDGALYIGVSSAQEIFESQCCTFRGSFQKLDLETGRTIWRTWMIPETESSNYTGVAVWGSSPPVDEKRGLVYVGTGNLYTVPSSTQACLDANGTDCIPSDICDDAIVAMDIHTGAIVWCNRLGGADVWRLACLGENPPPDCPDEIGGDFDFGEAPMFLTVPTNYGVRDILVTGQKSGLVWAHDRTTGELVWQTVICFFLGFLPACGTNLRQLAGPGGILGGAIWGSATDNHRVYTNIANGNMRNFTLQPSGEVTTGGGWVAMDAATGEIIWSTANPTGAPAYGPVTITSKGVLLVASFDVEGHVYALDAHDGSILWAGTTNATNYGGFSAAYGYGFVGSGYGASFGQAIGGTLGNFLFAFGVH